MQRPAPVHRIQRRRLNLSRTALRPRPVFCLRLLSSTGVLPAEPPAAPRRAGGGEESDSLAGAIFTPLLRLVRRTPPPLQGLAWRLHLPAGRSSGRGCRRPWFHLLPGRLIRATTGRVPAVALCRQCRGGAGGDRRAASRQNGRGMQVEGAACSGAAASHPPPRARPVPPTRLPRPPRWARRCAELCLGPVSASPGRCYRRPSAGRAFQLGAGRVVRVIICLSLLGCPFRTANGSWRTTSISALSSRGERVRSKQTQLEIFVIRLCKEDSGA